MRAENVISLIPFVNRKNNEANRGEVQNFRRINWMLKKKKKHWQLQSHIIHKHTSNTQRHTRLPGSPPLLEIHTLRKHAATHTDNADTHTASCIRKTHMPADTHPESWQMEHAPPYSVLIKRIAASNINYPLLLEGWGWGGSGRRRRKRGIIPN